MSDKLHRHFCPKRQWAGRSSRRLRFEAFEDRRLLAVLMVNSDLDNVIAGDGLVTLREAVNAANTNTTTDLGHTGAGNDTIQFAPELANHTIVLGGSQLYVSGNLTLTGLGVQSLTIDANAQSRAFEIETGVTASITDLTIRNGLVPSAERGGAIWNKGTLTLRRTQLLNNIGGYGGGVFNANSLTVIESTLDHNQGTVQGGAIRNESFLSLQRSTVTNNTSAAGGGIANYQGNLQITLSTISYNRGGSGGGVFNGSDGQATITNSTVAFNLGDMNNTGSPFGFGSGIRKQSGSLTLRNSIVAGNVRTTANVPDEIAGTVTAGNFSVIGNASTGGGLVDGVNGNRVGVVATAVIDPVLRDNGGLTLTHLPVSGSPALDAGLPMGAATDQTGKARTTNLPTVADAPGSGGTDIGAVEVTTFQVTSFTATSTGFIATFDQDLDTSILNLYDQDNLLGAADVTLTGSATGPVRGSLVVDPGLRKITFIASGGVLAPDNYSAVFKSGPNAFRDVLHGVLDGNTSGSVGDDYVGNFTIASPASNAVVLGVADLTRGYGQAMNLPASGAAGIPITLSSGVGVSGIDFKLLYNPQLLSISTVAVAPGIAGTLVYNNSVPGELQVTISSSSQLTATPGPITLVNITAQVPTAAPYAAKHVLDLANVHVYDTATLPAQIPAIDDDGIHIAAYFGDANGSQTYNAPDATLAQRVIVGTSSGLLVYQLADPNLIIDISANGLLQSNDVTLIQRAIVDLPVDEIPALPSLAVVSPGGPDPVVSIPQNLSGAVGETISVPIELLVTEPAGITLAGADLAIAYDATKFELSSVEVGALTIGFGLNVNLATPGIVRLSLAGNSALALPHNLAGTLATLQFTILAGAGSSSAINLLGQSSGLHTALYDEHGQALTLAPAPTDDDSDAVDGRVQIDWPQAVDAAFADGDDLA